MSSMQIPIQKQITKVKNHKRIQNTKKQSLLNLVLKDNLSTRQAAQKLQIKYSTAKYIVKNFKNKGNCLFDLQNYQNRQKLINQNICILVDVSDGNITMTQTIQRVNQNELSPFEEDSQHHNLFIISQLIHQEIKKTQVLPPYYQESTNSDYLKEFLKKQHRLMKQL